MKPQVLITLVTAMTAAAHGAEDAWLKIGGAGFGKDEKSVYGSVLVGKTLDKHLRFQLGATGAALKTFNGDEFSVRHGGSELELLGTYAFDASPVELSLGVSQPRTAARSATMASWKVLINGQENQGLKLYGDAYGVAGKDSISMVGGGALYRFSSGMSLDISGAFCIGGNNSVNTTTGANNRQAVYLIGLLFPVDANAKVGISITNQLGWTTGMSATPALGGRPGLGASYEVKF